MSFAPSAHKRLSIVRKLYERAKTMPLGRIKIGDSRSSYTRFRQQAGSKRIFDVQLASVYVAAENSAAANMDRDGDAMFLLAAGIANVTADLANPGQTLVGINSGTGIVNTLPVSIYQFMANTGTTNAHFSRVWVLYTTYGGTGARGMNSTNVATSTGGTPRRGLPYGATNPVRQLEIFRVTDGRATSAWWPFYAEAGQSADNSVESGIGPSANFAVPPAAAAGQLRITSEIWDVPAFTLTSGNGLSFRYRFASNPNLGSGGVFAGARVRFADVGFTEYCIAQGGQSPTDHMPVVAAGIANTDAKYTDDGIRVFLRSIATEPLLEIAIELGQNNSTEVAGLGEWDGVTIGRFKDNMRDIVLRWMRILREPEFASRAAVFKLIPHWYTASNRQQALLKAAALSELADELHSDAYPVTIYQQVAELEAMYAATAGAQGLDDSVGLMPANAGDPVHQNFDRVNLLSSAEWNAMVNTAEFAGLALGLGATAEMPPSRWQNAVLDDFVDQPFVSTYVRADAGGDLSVVWQDGTNETIANFPAAQAVPMRVRAVRSTGTTASGIQIGT